MLLFLVSVFWLSALPPSECCLPKLLHQNLKVLCKFPRLSVFPLFFLNHLFPLCPSFVSREFLFSYISLKVSKLMQCYSHWRHSFTVWNINIPLKVRLTRWEQSKSRLRTRMAEVKASKITHSLRYKSV